MEEQSCVEATNDAIKAASHLTKMDRGAVAALRKLARRVDTPPLYLNKDGDEVHAQFDNVTLPTYLRYCEALGLTPAARKAFETKPEGAPRESSIGKRRQSAALLRSA